MAKIRILPEQLANQIAAGEVVERPASVVKELLENSLDAGATRIEIEIEGGGTGLIRIIDNGEGMDEDDVLLSLERHGTSKITTDADLSAISTLGFRGEAIPSIGSVSKMTITSRRTDKELGTRAEVHFGKLIRVHEAGCGIGTIFEIRNLFGNTPARKKFLRTVRTELGHIDEVVRNYALARPEISFTLSVNGKRSFSLDNTLSLQERLASVMNYSGKFIEVGEDSHHSQSTRYVYGYLLPPEKLNIGPARLPLFVNGRAVKDRMISHGVAEGLRNFLMKGKNPAGLIHLVLPPDEVDVNVHPAKHEVRFRNSRDVHFLISSTVAAAMQHEQILLQTTMFGRDGKTATTSIPIERNQPAESPFQPEPATVHVSVSSPEHTTLAKPTSQPQTSPMSNRQAAPTIRQPETTSIMLEAPSRQIESPTLKTAEPPAPRQEPIAPCTPRPTVSAVPQQATLLPDSPEGHGLQIIGQFSDLYIFCRNHENQLLVIDQHAAHERLLFEELRRQYLGGTVVRQNLLFPENVELTLFQAKLVEQYAEELDQMGFSLREFGGNSYLISAVPALAGKSNPSVLLADVLEQFGSETNRRDSGDKIEHILSTMACKAAVKAGTTLSHREIDALLNKMAKADLFSHCPHGRPVVKLFNQREIQKWFYRT